MVIAVCEDDRIFVDGMRIAIQTWAQARGHQGIQVICYTSADDLWDDWEKKRVFDALFLDIEFPHMSGFELATRIRQEDPYIPIIFVSNTDSYLQQGYTVSAYRYLRKPIQTEEIHLCLDHCYRHSMTMRHEGFTLSKPGCMLRIPYRDVLFIQAGIHSIHLSTRENGDLTFPLKGSFESFAQSLPKDFFLRCHRGYIVNLMHVSKFTPKSITLYSNVEIPIGRSYLKPATARLQQYFFKEALL
jgi:DNA-binding LytR/AlgR family response regulator